MVMRFTDGAVGHKSAQDAMKTFSQDSYESKDDHECEMGAQEEGSGDPDVETGDLDAIEIGDRLGDELSIDDEDELGVIDEKEAGREEEIEYGYRMVDDEAECEDEPEDESDASDEDIVDLGPEDGEECWEDTLLDLEGYAVL
jgi:hypothetical protein